jgi:mannose-1-phosphate guanylyltransferase
MGYYALIMAGGVGTRLWPLSCRSRPKQVLRLIGERTMMQHAADRLAPLFEPEQVFVVARDEYVPLLSAQVSDLPLENYCQTAFGWKSTESSCGQMAGGSL